MTVPCRTVVTKERKKVMYIRKHGKKYQYLVRMKGVSVSQSFYNKSDATIWGKEKKELKLIIVFSNFIVKNTIIYL